MEPRVEHVFPGYRREAMLWAVWGFVFVFSFVLIVLNAVGWIDYLPESGRYAWWQVCLLLPLPLCGTLILLKIARLRGTTVEISSQGVRVHEWYGKSWWFSPNQGLQMDRKLRVYLAPGCSRLLSMPSEFPATYRIHTSDQEAYVRVDDEAGRAILVRLTEDQGPATTATVNHSPRPEH